MAKSDKTKFIEGCLWKENNKMGLFGCFEVTIGWFGTEIGDFITYKTNGEFRCYEIKVIKSDYNSKAALSFHGDFNYYVMPDSLYEELKKDVEKEVRGSLFLSVPPEKMFDERLKNRKVGLVTVSDKGYVKTVIKPKRKYPDLSMKMTLLQSMVRSQNREVEKYYKIKPYWTISG